MRTVIARFAHIAGMPVRALGRARRSIAGAAGRFGRWQADIPDQGRIALVGLILVGAGWAAVWPPAGAIVPGTVLVLVSLGLSLAHPVVATTTVAGLALLAITAIVRAG